MDGKAKGCAVGGRMRINERLMGSFANREPRCGHEPENNKEDEEYRECRGHVMFITSTRAHLRVRFAVVLVTWMWKFITHKLTEYMHYLI